MYVSSSTPNNYYNPIYNRSNKYTNFKGQEYNNNLKSENPPKNSNDKILKGGIGLILGAIVIGGVYLLTRGKGANAVKNAANSTSSNTDDVISKIIPEEKFCEKLIKNRPNFPKVGEKEITTNLQNGGKRVDFPSETSKYYDKNGKLTKIVEYREGVNLICVEKYQHGKLKSDFEVTLGYDNKIADYVFKNYDNKGNIISQIRKNNKSVFNYSENNDISKVVEKIYERKGAGNLIKMVEAVKKDHNVVQRSTIDYANNTKQIERFDDPVYSYILETKDISKDSAGVLKSKTTHKIIKNSKGEPVKVILETTGTEPKEIPYSEYKYRH